MNAAQNLAEVHAVFAASDLQPIRESRRTNFARAVALVVAAALLGGWLAFSFGFVRRTSHLAMDGHRYFMLFDDGMISMRYARNFVDHHELVWNLGERVEGFTNPLWTGLMVAAVWLTGTHFAPLVVQILGGMTGLSVFAVFVCCAWRRKFPPIAIVAGLFLMVGSFPMTYWAWAGMEAIAITLVFVLALFVQESYEANCSRNPIFIHAGLVILAYALRPDGWLVISPFLAACWMDALRERQYRKAFLAPALIAAAMAIVLLLRFIYYGEWIPNTYVLKMVGYSFGLRLQNGIAFVRPFCEENLGLFALVVFGTFTKRRVAFLSLVGALICLAYQVYVGGDPWTYWRQLLPIYAAAACGVLFCFQFLSDPAPAEQADFQGDRARLGAIAALIALPILLYEYLLHLGGTEYTYRRLVLKIAAALAAGMLLYLSAAKKRGTARRSQHFRFAARLLVTAVICYAVLIGNFRFSRDFTGKPYSYDEQAKLLDKALLAGKLFGPGKLHHACFAGTYSYYVDGKVIDALGKSDKIVARYPVDTTVAWQSMLGVPGHAKHNFRETILARQPDIIPDFTRWGSDNVKPEIDLRYTLIDSGGTSLCVKNELLTGLEALNKGMCPRKSF